MKSYRIEWIDITKGIAIFLMVIGHTSIPKCVSNYIWSFHMPLFFLISGVLYDADKYNSFSKMIRRRVQTLIVPYVFFSLVVFYGMFLLDMADIKELYLGWNGYALWFIPVLFITEIMFNRIIKYVRLFKENYSTEIIAIVLSLLGFVLSIVKIHFPFKLEVSLFAVFFYATGFNYKRMLTDEPGKYKKWLVPSIILQMTVVQFMPNIDMASNKYGLYVPNFIIALVGTLNIIALSRYICLWRDGNIVKRFLIWAGKNTFVILGLSQMVNLLMKSLLSMSGSMIANSILRHCLLWIILYLCSVALNGYVPILVGKRNR